MTQTPDAQIGAEFLSASQFCELLGIDERTAMRWRGTGCGPKFVRIGPRRVVYRRSDVDAWVAARTFKHRAAEAVAA